MTSVVGHLSREGQARLYAWLGLAVASLVGAGLKITGRTPDGVYVEIVEDAAHPWFLGCQFHPEFKSKPLAPHPLFAAFVGASLEHRRTREAAARKEVATPKR